MLGQLAASLLGGAARSLQSGPALTHPRGTQHGHCPRTRAALGSVIPKLLPGNLCSSASTRVAIPVQIAPSSRCVCKRPPDQLFSSL